MNNDEWEIVSGAPKEVADNQDRSLTQELGRGTKRTAARVFEGIAGGTGGLVSSILNIPSFVSGGRIPSYDEVYKLAQERYEKMSDLEKTVFNKPQRIPTAEDVREHVTKPLTGNELEPESEGEQEYDKYAELIGSLLSGNALKGAAALGNVKSLGAAGEVAKGAGKALLRATGLATAGTGAAKTAEYLGASPAAQEVAKIGAIILTDAIPGGRKFLENKAKQAYKVVDSIPETVPIEAPHLEQYTDKLKKYVESGLETTSKGEMAKVVSRTQRALKAGKKQVWEPGKGVVDRTFTPIKEVAQIERDINNLLRDHTISNQSKALLGKMKDSIEPALTDFASKNPEWGTAYNDSKDIWRGLNQRSFINKFLNQNKNVELKMTTQLGKDLLFGALLENPIKVGGKLTAIATAKTIGKGLGKGVEFFEFLKNSKNAQAHYWEALGAAAENNKAAFLRSALRFDKDARDYESRESESDDEWERLGT